MKDEKNYFEIAGVREPKGKDESLSAWKARAMAAIYQVADLRKSIVNYEKIITKYQKRIKDIKR